jgi:hypothetical protein
VTLLVTIKNENQNIPLHYVAKTFPDISSSIIKTLIEVFKMKTINFHESKSAVITTISTLICICSADPTSMNKMLKARLLFTELH